LGWGYYPIEPFSGSSINNMGLIFDLSMVASSPIPSLQYSVGANYNAAIGEDIGDTSIYAGAQWGDRKGLLGGDDLTGVHRVILGINY